MIVEIQGMELVDYNSSKSGKRVQGLQVYVAFTNSKVFGFKTNNVYLGFGSPIYEELRSFSNPLDLVGRQLNLEYNERGFIDDCSLIPVAVPVPAPVNK